MLKKITLVLITLIFIPTGVSAATYYVDDVSTNGNGSENSPWNSIQYAVNQKDTVKPGDTILIKPGNYSGPILIKSGNSVEGTAGNPVTIKSQNPSSKATLTNNNFGKVIELVDVSNIIIQDLYIKDYKGYGILARTSSKDIESVYILNNKLENQSQGTDTTGWAIAASSQNSQHTAKNIHIKNNELTNIQTGSYVDGQYKALECIRYDGEVINSIIQNNIIHDCHFIAIDILGGDGRSGYSNAQPKYIVVKDNVITGTTTAPHQSNQVYLDRAKGPVLIEKNKLNSNRSVMVYLNVEPWWDGSLNEFGDVIIRNNTGKGDHMGLLLGNGNNSGPSTLGKYYEGVRVSHNKINPIKNTQWNRSPVFFYGAKDIALKNNVFIGTNESELLKSAPWRANDPQLSGDRPVLNGNIWYGSNASASQARFEYLPNNIITGFTNYQSQTNQDQDSFYANPQFVNESEGDYRLKPDTPGHEQGIALTTTDGSGNNTNTIKVKDAKYFYDGWDIEGEVGDRIKVGGVETRVTKVNYNTNTLTVSPSITFSNNAPVNYYYEGNNPSIGLLPDSFYDKGDIPNPTPNQPTPSINPKYDLDGNDIVDIRDLLELVKYIFR